MHLNFRSTLVLAVLIEPFATKAECNLLEMMLQIAFSIHKEHQRLEKARNMQSPKVHDLVLILHLVISEHTIKCPSLSSISGTRSRLTAADLSCC